MPSVRTFEIVATVLLSVATLATAWSGYQASRWNGEQAKAAARANASRVESTRASGLANRNAQIDLALFTQWADAYAQEQTMLADFYRQRFRKEFVPAFEAWVATRPLRNPRAPLSPFAMPEYVLDSADRGRSPGGGRRGERRRGATEHPALLELRPCRDALRGRALLRRHQHPADPPGPTRSDPRPRVPRLRLHSRLDRVVPGERRGLNEVTRTR